MIQIIYQNIISEYCQKGHSLIPLKANSKIPIIKWKSYQNEKADLTDILDWHIKYNNPNFAIITGDISQLAVIDVDNPSISPELIKIIPEMEKTTRVKTKKGHHYYFSLNGDYVKSTNTLFDKRLELKSNGSYVVAPPSIIEGFEYVFEVPLSKILPIPKILLKKEREPVSCVKDGGHNVFKIPKYHGEKADCIRQIFSRDLQEGERNNSLFILYNLLLRNKNTQEYSKTLVINKNNSLLAPLPELELKKVYRKTYNYGCSAIREKLAYIKCKACEYRFKDGKLKTNNILIKNMGKLFEISNTQRGIACLLGTVYDGESPSISEITEKTKMNFKTVKNAIEGLKEQGFFK